MNLPKPPKFDLIPNTDYDLLIVGATLVGLLYVGTGGWTEKRWAQFGAAMGPLITYVVGYNTYNPKLHQAKRDARGRFVSQSEERLD